MIFSHNGRIKKDGATPFIQNPFDAILEPASFSSDANDADI